MKRILAVFLLTVATVAYAKVDPNEFSMTIHVWRSTTGQDCSTRGCSPTQVIRATIDGNKYALQAETILSKGVLPLGDYKAKLLGKENPKNPLKRKYEFLLEDGSTRKFKIVGEEE